MRYVGDWAVDDDVSDRFARLRVTSDGEVTDDGTVIRVREIETRLRGRLGVAAVFDAGDLPKAPQGKPLGLLEDGVWLEVPDADARVRDVRSERSGTRRTKWELLEVAWGEPVQWELAMPLDGRPPVVPSTGLVVVATAAPDEVVPDLAKARQHLSSTSVLPGGEDGQGLRERGVDWPSVPRASDWTTEDSLPWLVAGLLELVLPDPPLTGLGRRIEGFHPVILSLVPDGAPVVLTGPQDLFTTGVEGPITLWEGRDSHGNLAAVTLVASGRYQAATLPPWTEIRREVGTVWGGGTHQRSVAYEDEHGVFEYVAEYVRVQTTPRCRLTFPSQQVIVAHPDRAGTADPLAVRLPGTGPFELLDVRMLDNEDAESDRLEEGLRGALLLISREPPVRWELAVTMNGEDPPVGRGNMVAIADAHAGEWVQAQREEGLTHKFSHPLVPFRSNPAEGADVVVLSGFGGDSNIWVAVGFDNEDRVAAVLVDNYDINSLERGTPRPER